MRESLDIPSGVDLDTYVRAAEQQRREADENGQRRRGNAHQSVGSHPCRPALVGTLVPNQHPEEQGANQVQSNKGVGGEDATPQYSCRNWKNIRNLLPPPAPQDPVDVSLCEAPACDGHKEAGPRRPRSGQTIGQNFPVFLNSLVVRGSDCGRKDRASGQGAVDPRHLVARTKPS